MGVKVRKIDQLDEYRDKINQMGALQVERMTVPLYVFDWTYKLFGQGLHFSYFFEFLLIGSQNC